MENQQTNILARLREAKGYTQEVAAEKIGTTKMTVYRLEKGRLGLSDHWQRKFAELYGVKIKDLYDPDFQPMQHAARDSANSAYKAQAHTPFTQAYVLAQEHIKSRKDAGNWSATPVQEGEFVRRVTAVLEDLHTKNQPLTLSEMLLDIIAEAAGIK